MLNALAISKASLEPKEMAPPLRRVPPYKSLKRVTRTMSESNGMVTVKSS